MKANPNAAFPSPESKTPVSRWEDSLMHEEDFREMDFCFTKIEFPGVMPVHPTRAGTDPMYRIACPVHRDWRYTALRASILSG